MPDQFKVPEAVWESYSKAWANTDHNPEVKHKRALEAALKQHHEELLEKTEATTALIENLGAETYVEASKAHRQILQAAIDSVVKGGEGG